MLALLGACDSPASPTDGAVSPADGSAPDGSGHDAATVETPDASVARDAPPVDAYRPPVDCENVLVPGVWTEITPPDPHFEPVPFYNEVQVDPSDPCTIYAVGAGFMRSTDGGASWELRGEEWLTIPQRLRIDPADPDHMYTMQGVHAFGLFRTFDGGVTWERFPGFEAIRPSIGGTDDIYGLEVDPADFGHFLVSFHSPWTCEGGCAGGVVECFDGGERCEPHPVPEAADNGGWSVFFLSSPAHGLGDGSTWLYMTQPGGRNEGYFRTTDAGATWTHVFDQPMVHGGSQTYYSTAGVLYAATWNGLARSSDNGAHWERLPDGTRPYDGYFSVGGDGARLYMLGGSGGSIQTSPETDGATWTADTTHTFQHGVTLWTYDPRNRVMYAAVREDGVWALKLP
ncbi:MAG: hypothetical protein U0234_30135 [Sandaracinus sp.]